MNETVKLAEFVSNFNLDMVSNDVIVAAENCVLDFLGCAIFATQTDVGQIISAYAKEHNEGLSTIFPDLTGKRYNASLAALANGTLAHGFELDDIDQPSVSHPGAPIIAAALALAQEHKVSGRRFLEAIIAGYEVNDRVGKSVMPGHLDRHHPTGTITTFGAAAACCKILDLSAEQTAWAFGICGSLASGIAQFSISGSMVKRIHAGKAAQQGVMAACLAKSGFTGPIDILEGKKGFCVSFRGDMAKEACGFEKLTENLGQSYAIVNTTFKPTCNCGVLHSTIECLLKIKEDSRFDAEKIIGIEVIGNENLATGHNDFAPNSILSAQYSLPFTVGMTLVGNIWDPSLYLSDALLSNRKILDMGRKIKTAIDPEMEALWPAQFAAAVSVEQSDGVTLSHKVMFQKGTPQNPFSRKELLDKYMGLVCSVLPKEQAEKIAENVYVLDTLSCVEDLFVS